MKEYAVLTVIGRDRTGVVARITNFLFEQHANIEAREEQVPRGQFSLPLQASWSGPAGQHTGRASGLANLAQSLGMEIKVRWFDPRRRQRLALMVTAETHCAQALLEAWKSGRLGADPAILLSNRRDVAGLARQHQLPDVFIPWENRAAAETQALELIEKHQADFIVLARFMKILSPNFVWRYKNKIINIHPSLLPSFPGPQAYRQAYEYGVKLIGVTAHFVSMRLDEGPIIAQASAPIPSNATLKQIVAVGQRLESRTLLKAVRLYLSKRLDVHWGVVKAV